MNYEEKYKTALERAKKELLSCGSTDCDAAKQIYRFFPELKESDDGRIRNQIIDFIEKYGNPTYYEWQKDWIAWLEKQVISQERTGIEWLNAIDDACDKRYSEEYAEGEYCHEQSFKWGFQEGVEWLERQGEQKPKFRIGDVIKEKSTGDIVTISEVDLKNREYRLSNTGFIPFKYEYLWELAEQNTVDKPEQNFHKGEGERIRKGIIRNLEYLMDKSEGFVKDELSERIAWLERQGEQKSAKNIVETWKDMRLEVYQQASGNRHEPNYSDDTTKMFSLNDIDEIIEKLIMNK